MGNLSLKSFAPLSDRDINPLREHELYVELSTKFLKDEEEHKVKWPGIIHVSGRGRSRTVVVSEEYLDTVTTWFDIYGCSHSNISSK